MRGFVAAMCAILFASCADVSQERVELDQEAGSAEESTGTNTANRESSGSSYTEPERRQIRLTGVVEAVRSARLTVPALSGQSSQLTLTDLVENGIEVQEGDLIAAFDPTQQLDDARSARGQFDDLSHQVDQKRAENRAASEQRQADLQQAEADLRKAELEVSKAEILGDIVRQQNQIQLEKAQAHVESLTKSIAFHDQAEAAALRILELKRDRQRVALERAQANLEKLELLAPQNGMAAHDVYYRNGSMIHPQEGDQLYRGYGLVKLFDPSEMLVQCQVGEPDGDILEEGMQATVYFDAYPDLALPAHFVSASPIATALLGTQLKTFSATFQLDATDPRLMPDLSAAVVVDVGQSDVGQSIAAADQEAGE